MHRIITIILFIFILSVYSMQAQDTTSFVYVDKITYEQYNEKNWNALIKTGLNAIANGLDYYYLRMRIGIAFYEKKNYSSAQKHFERALDFDPSNETAQEYLYYSYLFSGRDGDAQKLAFTFLPEMKKRLNLKIPVFIAGLHPEGGYSTSGAKSASKELNLLRDDSIMGRNDFIHSTVFYTIGLSHLPSKSCKIFHAFSNFIFTKEYQFQNIQPDLNFPVRVIQNGQVTDLPIMKKVNLFNEEYTLNQKQYYLNFSFYPGKGNTWSPFLHILNLQYTVFNEANIVKTSPALVQIINAPGDTTYNTIPFSYPSVNITKKDTGFTDFILGLSYSKSISKFNFGINASLSKINAKQQQQFGLSALYMPMGNKNLYFIGNATLWNEITSTFSGRGRRATTTRTTESRFIYEQIAGFKIFSKLWTEFSATFGTISDFHERNAYIVYNNLEKIKQKYTVSLYVLLKPNIEISLRYGLKELENSYKSWSEPDVYKRYSFKYFSQTLTGGIKWKF